MRGRRISVKRYTYLQLAIQIPEIYQIRPFGDMENRGTYGDLPGMVESGK